MTYQAGIAISWPMLFICIYRYDQVKHDEDDTKVTKADDLMLQAQKMKKKRKKKNYSQIFQWDNIRAQNFGWLGQTPRTDVSPVVN